MAQGTSTLDAGQIRAALRRLGELAQANGRHVHLVAVGGAVMVLKYRHRETTKDVDAIFREPHPTAPIRGWAARVSEELGLPADWLNDGAKAYVGEAPPEGETLFEASGITMRAASPEVLLGSKLAAFRDAVDRSDALRILTDLEGEKDDIWRRVEPCVQPRDALTKACYAFDELWDEIHGHD